ncbi:retrovirus-related pol polyprotein from transposon TNT 1-94 [Tanacetum coccineum]|uniref:Retrovirus-related pol polyprotein from transposon TNT 1-94 n=1 Tax=Tanacetum coccineum TaxID=301880 RepID=A0ABQ5H5C5_9ASTR
MLLLLVRGVLNIPKRFFQNVFNQIEAAVDQCSIDKNAFEIQIKQLSIDNDQLLKQIMSQEIMHIAMIYVDSFKLFELNELKAQSQEKDTVIRKLKDRIKSLSGKDSLENVKKDIDEIETINIELEHSVAKLLSENENLRKEREHLKSIYKDQFDSIRKTCVQSKEHCDSLIAQINAKSVENSDLNAQLQEKVFAIKALKNELRKVKGKNVVDTAVSKPNATIAPGMFKLDIEPISHRLKNNRDAHEVYIEKTIENTDTLCEFVECARTQNPSEPLLESAWVKPTTSASESKPSGNTKNNRITQQVEDHSRKVKSSLNKMNSVYELVNNALVKHSIRNAKFEYVCAICNKCLFDANHDMCIIDYVNDVNMRSKFKSKRNKMRKVWKPTGKVFSEIGYSWKPTGRNITIIGNRCPLTRITLNKIVPPKETTIAPVVTPTSRILVYSKRPKATRFVGSSSKVKIVESKTSNSKEPKQSWGSTVSDVPSSSLSDCRLSKLVSGTVRFGNDHIAKIMGYGDYQIGNVTISWVYYVEGLGLPKLKYQKDHLCSACALGKSKKHSHKPKAKDSIQEKLYLLHMDLCWPMRVQSINGRKYILVIVDDFSRFTWVKFLRSKDEVLEFVIKFLKMIQVRLNATVCNIRTDNGTEFVNQTLKAYYEEVRISHQTSVSRSLQQNGVVVATACHTQNRSLIQKRHNKTPYEILHDRKPDLSYLHVFGALCYPTNDGEDLGKLKPKADIGIFVGYAPTKKAF